MAGSGTARLGGAGQVWRGQSRLVQVRLGLAGMDWRVREGLGSLGFGWFGVAGVGRASHGSAWLGRPIRHRSQEGDEVSGNGKSVAATVGHVVDEAPADAIQIDKIAAETLHIPILGTTPLIVHRFSEKAKRQMLDAMQGRKSPKQPKDPQAEYEAAFYRLKDGGYGFPVIAFKAATVGGARFYGGVTMKALKQFIFFRGEVGEDGQSLARIEGEPKIREDVVRVGRGGTDLRYRPEFPEWSTVIEVVYVTSVLTRASVLSLIDAGGMGVGVGEWRPERDGDFGTYRIDPDREVEVVS